jgi:hypothetical protein
LPRSQIMTKTNKPELQPEKLYRYSKRKWLEDSLCNGIFRLNSASYIKTLEGDVARHDDEMRLELTIPKDTVKITHLKTGNPIIPISDVKIVDEITTDYYMLCLSSKKASYLFEDFKGSNACLIIHNPIEFSKRIFKSAKKALPYWVGVDAQVTYGGSSQFGPTFSKPLKQFFQFEWRFSWVPLIQKENNLDCMFIEIGNIEDIAQIVDKF